MDFKRLVNNLKISRRRFNEVVVASAALALHLRFAPVVMAEPKPNFTAPDIDGKLVDLSLKVNGVEHRVSVDSRTTLLDLLREQLSLTGSKKGCDHGQCGACTVLVNKRRVYSCMSFAVMHQTDEIVTIEGLAEGDKLHPMQQAFIEHDGFQCGYCTPGQIMSAVGLLGESCGKSNSEVQECMNGNLCRCGAYPNIVAAIQEVRGG